MRERKRKHDDAHFPMQGSGRKAMRVSPPTEYRSAYKCEDCGSRLLTHLCKPRPAPAAPQSADPFGYVHRVGEGEERFAHRRKERRSRRVRRRDSGGPEMSDQELLELAAKAAGVVGTYYAGVLNDEYVEGIVYIRSDGQQCVWNPLADDGDALRLAVKLKIDVAHTNIHSPQVHALADLKVQEWEDSSKDPCAATRRAIVRAAAEIGRTK